MLGNWRLPPLLAPAALALAVACGTVEEAPIVEGQGAKTGSGGASTGGATASGGNVATGGLAGTGGASGGSFATGGGSSGGATGGTVSDGGSPGTGGIIGDGGTSSGGTPPETGGSDTGGSTSTGVCGGDTPHGCYTPKPGNPSGCPPQIPEQSGLFPTPDEKERCTSLPYVPCYYEKPGGGEANCRCNLGENWICAY